MIRAVRVMISLTRVGAGDLAVQDGNQIWMLTVAGAVTDMNLTAIPAYDDKFFALLLLYELLFLVNLVLSNLTLMRDVGIDFQFDCVFVVFLGVVPAPMTRMVRISWSMAFAAP